MLEPEVKGAAAAAPDGAEDRAERLPRNSERQLLVDVERRPQDRSEAEREDESAGDEGCQPNAVLRQF